MKSALTTQVKADPKAIAARRGNPHVNQKRQSARDQAETKRAAEWRKQHILNHG